MARRGMTLGGLAALLLGAALGARTNLDIENAAKDLARAEALEESLLASAEEAEEFLLDARRQGEAGPAFDPSVLGASFDKLRDKGPAPCGARLTTTAHVKWSSVQDLADPHVRKDFFSTRQYGHRDQLLANAWRFESIMEMDWDSDLMGGREPVQVGRQRGPFTDANHFAEALLAEFEVVGEDGNMPSKVPVTFDLGLDLRACWGDLQDQSGRGVCNGDVLRDLAADVRKVEPKTDKAGQSGSTIITNLRGFIVKNVADDEERSLIQKVLPNFSDSFTSRQGSCYSTGVAPLCAVLAGPGGVEWLVMRKVELPGAKKLSFELDGDRVKFQDLKGPEFLKGVRDLKTYVGKAHVWKVKDPGFARLFPEGLKLRGCGGRDAAKALGMDTALLLANGMTDYSFFVKYYEAPADEDYTCQCDDASAPKFPLVLDVEAPGEGRRPMRLAVGIIDYIETEVRGGVKSYFSTMKSPEVYREWFMKMWPAYFHLPERTLRMDGKGKAVTEASDHQPAERVSIGQGVLALETMRWHAEGWWGPDLEKEVYASNRVWKAFVGLADEDTPSHTEDDDHDYNIFAGDLGTVRNIVPEAYKGSKELMLAVEWQRYPSRLYYTRPHLVQRLAGERSA